MPLAGYQLSQAEAACMCMSNITQGHATAQMLNLSGVWQAL